MPVSVLVCTAVLAAGCGGDGGGDGGGDATPSQAASSSASTPGGPSALPSVRAYASVEDRCTVGFPGARLETIVAKDGSRIFALTKGSGPRAAVFLHQTGAAGVCGWIPFAAQASKAGVRVVLIDNCGTGGSACTSTSVGDPTRWVGAAVDWARKQGSSSVTVVGASMGGAIALGVGQKAGADAIVDLSGPGEWINVPSLAQAAPRTTVPLMLACSPRDSGMPYTEMKQLLPTVPATHKVFVEGEGDIHGWSLVTSGPYADGPLTPVGRRVLAWVQGRY